MFIFCYPGVSPYTNVPMSVYRSIALFAVFAASSTATFALPTICWWTESYGECVGMSAYDVYEDVTYWNLSCDDGTFLFGSLQGNQTDYLCY